MTGPAAADVMTEREWAAPFDVDLRRTLSVQGRGRGDPTFTTDEAGAIWRTSLTPDGPATIRVLPVRASAREDQPARANEETPGATTRVRAQAWGPGAPWLLDALAGALGLYDDISGFAALVPDAHPVIRDAARRHPGLRIGRSGRLMEALVPAILEQKVVILEAHRAWRILLAKYGTPPPARHRAACESSRRRAHGAVSRPGTGTGPGWKASAPRRSSGPRAWLTAWSGCSR
jgi:hypothetical protein